MYHGYIELFLLLELKEQLDRNEQKTREVQSDLEKQMVNTQKVIKRLTEEVSFSTKILKIPPSNNCINLLNIKNLKMNKKINCV